MAKNKSLPKLFNVEVKTSYYANGHIYGVVEKDDTVRFYRLEEHETESSEGTLRWVPTDIYLKTPITVIGLEN